MYPPACIHGDGKSLCPSCQACYDYDPSAYIEYGDHPQGIANTKALDEQIAADAVSQPYVAPDPNIPF